MDGSDPRAWKCYKCGNVPVHEIWNCYKHTPNGARDWEREYSTGMKASCGMQLCMDCEQWVAGRPMEIYEMASALKWIRDARGENIISNKRETRSEIQIAYAIFDLKNIQKEHFLPKDKMLWNTLDDFIFDYRRTL
jgi:hypothetical protein